MRASVVRAEATPMARAVQERRRRGAGGAQEGRRRGAGGAQQSGRVRGGSAPTPNPASAGKLTVTSARRSTGSRLPHGKRRRGRHHRLRAPTRRRRQRRRWRRRRRRRRPWPGPPPSSGRPTTPTRGCRQPQDRSLWPGHTAAPQLPTGPWAVRGSSRVCSAARGLDSTRGPESPPQEVWGSEQWHCPRRRFRHDMPARQHLFMMKSTISS